MGRLSSAIWTFVQDILLGFVGTLVAIAIIYAFHVGLARQERIDTMRETLNKYEHEQSMKQAEAQEARSYLTTNSEEEL